MNRHRADIETPRDGAHIEQARLDLALGDRVPDDVADLCRKRPDAKLTIGTSQVAPPQ